MSLSDLPTELIVHVFKSVDNISSAAALSSTSRQLHAIWRCNLGSICDAVLPRVIECYDQALQLLKARAKPTPVASQSSVDDKAEAAIVRAKVLFTNADLAYLTLKQFEVDFIVEWEAMPEQLDGCACIGIRKDQRGHRFLEPFNRIRFLQGYYRAMSMMYLAKNSGPMEYQILTSMNLLDFFQMKEVMEWLFDYCDEDPVPDENILLPGYNSLPSTPGERLGKRSWLERLERYNHLAYVEIDLVKISGVKPPINESRVGGDFFQLILHEDCLGAKTDRAKGIALADLLPLLPNYSSVNPGFELLAPHWV